jgi:hypothetical protein
MVMRTRTFSCSLVVLLGVLSVLPRVQQSFAQALTNGLVAYWPLDELQAGKTPDVVSGYDMEARNLVATDVVPGVRTNAFSFFNARQTLLSRVHAAGDDLPINKHPAFTVSMWAKVNGPGQVDLRVFSEANTTVSDPLFNIGTHNTGASGQVDLLIRQGGSTQVGHILTTAEPFDDAWHHIVFTQQTDGTRTFYIDGVADDLVIGPKPAGFNYNFNDTTIGGILRASPSHWVTGLIDEVAVWKRALTEAEINDVRVNGVPRTTSAVLPLEIRSFTAEFPAVAQGDRVFLRWDASKDATLSITGIGDVTGISTVGVGSTNVLVNQSTTFQLVATRSGQSVTSQVQVVTVPNVATNWRLIENFNSRPAGRIAGNWLNPEGIAAVVDLGLNKVLTYENGDDLAAVPLSSMTVTEGQRATLFFRLYVSPDDLASVLGSTFGLTDRPIRFNGDFNGNVGPYVRLERISDGAPIELQAHNGVGASYDPASVTIEPGSVYKLWIDVDNRPFNVVDGVQNGGDIYSVLIQKEGDAARTTIFQDYVSDRDAVTIDPALGAPGPNLTHVFIAALGGSQGTNVFFDDFYLSQGAFNSTTPVPASSFVKVDAPAEIRITSATKAGNSFTLQWSARAGATYNVLKKTTLSGAWAPIASGIPTGGATGASVSYTDTAATGSSGFYQISQSP